MMGEGWFHARLRKLTEEPEKRDIRSSEEHRKTASHVFTGDSPANFR